ncbi:hypothetical protein ES705_38037 [subsurface metagenome]
MFHPPGASHYAQKKKKRKIDLGLTNQIYLRASFFKDYQKPGGGKLPPQLGTFLDSEDFLTGKILFSKLGLIRPIKIKTGITTTMIIDKIALNMTLFLYFKKAESLRYFIPNT